MPILIFKYQLKFFYFMPLSFYCISIILQLKFKNKFNEMHETKVFIHFNLFTGAYYAEDFFKNFIIINFKFMNCSF